MSGRGRQARAERRSGMARTPAAGSGGPHTYTPVEMQRRITGAGARDRIDDSGMAEVEPKVAMALLSSREQERSRLAEELHDGPAQALANAIFQAQIAERALASDPTTAHAELASLREILEGELETLRSYINQLRPSLAEAEGFDDALRDSAAAISERTGIPVELKLEASGIRLHTAARTAALRVAQEALRNIAKHSAASHAWVKTSETSKNGSSRWVLEVGDDGRGFDYQSVTARKDRRHFGLRFMRERAELMDSELSIETSPAAGTVVRLTIDTGG